MSKSLTILISVVVLLCPSSAVGTIEQRDKDWGGPYLAEDHELPFLPPYCRFCAGVNKNQYSHERGKWKRIFRGRWAHVHHYCYGLLSLSRLERGVGKRSAQLKRAEREFSYVITHSTPKNNILLPEVYLKRGITRKLKGKNIEAIKDFFKAIEIKKDYVPPYLQLIDFFKNNGDFKSAIGIAKRGLKYSPNSKLLKGKLKELQSLFPGH